MMWFFRQIDPLQEFRDYCGQIARFASLRAPGVKLADTPGVYKTPVPVAILGLRAAPSQLLRIAQKERAIWRAIWRAFKSNSALRGWF